MKNLLILFFTAVSTIASAQAPNANEWLRQKATQRKYLIQQIAALKIYLDFLKKGYTVAQKGMNLIATIKDGSFNSHNGYFTSLKQVSRVVRNSPKLNLVLQYQNSILIGFRKLYDDCQLDGNFSPAEIAYIEKVYHTMLFECNVSIDELVILATAGNASMKDDGRLLRLDKVYDDLQEKFSFAQRFINTTRALSHERSREITQMDGLKKLIDAV